jgi:protein phosphatase
MLIRGGCGTDIGISRKNNQDAIMFEKYENSGDVFAMGVICDGIGGLEHGEEASYSVIKAAKHWFDGVTSWIKVKEADRDIIFAHFMDAVEEWNYTVRDLIKTQNISTGTTMSAVIILQEYYYIVHVGDSRIYRFNCKLEQITNDESIARMTNNGMKMYLENYIGREDELSFKTYQGNVESGDMFIYSSDGFYHTLELEDVEMIYRRIKDEDIQTICMEAIKDRIEKRETDNISVGIIYCE